MSETCKYRLPCGWCDKKDKLCDLPKTNEEKIATLEANHALGCDHEWEWIASNSLGETFYRCRKCHKTKKEVRNERN